MRVLSLFAVAAAPLLALAASAPAAPSTTLPVPVMPPLPPTPRGFVAARNGQFELDGKPFYFVGTNAYWLPQLSNTSDVDTVLASMQAAGVKVLRTWAWSMINATAVPADAGWLTYYQVWNGSDYTLNTGANGLPRLDYVVAAAGRYGIKLILTLTNNWDDYGGMEMYVDWVDPAGTHDAFYTNPTIVGLYQKYVTAIVNRYKGSPNVFAWELANEARCGGTRQGSAGCAPSAGGHTLSTWYAEQSAFIKRLDPHHMVTKGGEGWLYITNSTQQCYFDQCVYDYSFDGGPGEDFVADLAIPTLDFAVYHQYPQSWEGYWDRPGTNLTLVGWGTFWEQTHANASRAAGKPVVLEEFGYLGAQNQTQIYPQWISAALAGGQAGVMPWQWGQLGLAAQGGKSPDDGYAIYPNTTAFDLLVAAAKVQNAKSR